MINKIVKRITLVSTLLLFFLILICNTSTLVFASETNSEMNVDELSLIDKYEITVDDNFDESKVIVTLTKEYSDINKEINYNDFETDKIITLNTIMELNIPFEDYSDKIVINDIYDLTYLDNPNMISNPDEYRQIFLIELMNGNKEDVITVIEELETKEYIIAAEPQYMFSIDYEDEELYLNDAEYGRQWGLNGVNGIQIENAWSLIGDGSVDQRIRVGIFESGVQSNHPDLRIITGNRTGIAPHGTHVAGIIGAIGNNEIGISGIAQVEIALLDYGPMTTIECVEFAQSLTWAINNNIRIVNASFKFIYNGQLAPAVINHVTAIQNFGLANGLFICSAGNNNVNNDVDTHKLLQYPAGYADSRLYPEVTNIISVGSIEENGEKSSFSNFGENSVHLFAPGGHIYSTITGSSYGYNSGTSMATPHVTGVAALLLSINENLTNNQLREAILNSVTIPNNSGINPLNNLCITDGRLNAYNAVKYVLEHFSNTEYTLSNYSSTINTNKTIASDASYFNELNGFYKLNVTYAKNYEFISSSASGIEVTLYDEDFTEISFNDLDSTSNKVHFIKNLSIGTYYLRTKYISEDSTGTINTKIISRNTAYLTVGENDILINSYNGFRDYNFTNQNKPGFFKFAFVGEKEDGSLIVYPSNAIKIYNDSNKTQLLQKFDLGGYDNSASLKQNEDNMYVYLPRSGYFYLDVNFNTAGLKSLKLVITEATSDNLNLFDLSENTNETINVINENKKGDYFKALHLKQTGKFTVNFNYFGIQSNNILVVLTKQNYNETTREYSLDTKVIAFLNKDNPTYTYSASLEDGMYYIGYFNKADTSTVTATFERLVTQSGSEVLVTDPDQGTLCGSQINIIEMNHFNKSYRQTFITVGFTRLIYPNYNYGISPSRLDYDWYSSNTSIATVTNYGTVLGKSAGTVKIMAVLKSDPSKVYVKEFTIINDTGTGIVEIHSTYTVKYSRDVVNGKFHFDMEKINCPYPWLQDYTWSLNNNCHGNSIGASMDNWGDITINGTGCFTLTGTYNVNSRYRVIIHFVIEP